MTRSFDHSRVLAWLALVIAGASATACAAPVQDDEATATESQAQSTCYPAKTCGDPPPPPPTCSYNALTTYPIRPGDPVPQTDVTTYPEGCIQSKSTDALSNVERTLIQSWGCSLPVYVKRQNQVSPGTDWWNAYALLCPINNDLENYIDDLATGGPLPGANAAPHYNYGYGDAEMPSPPLGLFWVIPWQDPMCMNMGGCMVSNAAM
jgi:hypothetical protein